MTNRFVLAIDTGSQSTKVHVVDQHGIVHASARTPLRPTQLPGLPEQGHVVHPDDDLWDAVVDACRRTLDAFDGDPADVEGVGLCGIRFCRAYLDPSGRLVEPVLSWMDARVSQAMPPRADVAWVTTSSGYLTHRLTGAFRDAAATYQGVWPIDVATARWSDDPAAYRQTGMPREKLFELVDPAGVLGHVTAAAEAATGLRAGTPVFATANDKAVEALGAGVGDATVLLSLGTYIAAMTTGSTPTSASTDYWVNFACRPGRYLYESNGIRRGMWTVSWVRDLVAPMGTALPEGLEAEEVLNREAGRVGVGSGGLMAVLDWLAPTDRPYRRGALLGFMGGMDRGHVYRAVVEGIVLTMADHIDAMLDALDRRPTDVVVTGRGAKSDLAVQIVADVLGLPTRRAGMNDAAGLGAAMCVAVGLGIHPDFDAAAAAMIRSGRAFVPRPEGVAAYRPIRARYRLVRRFTDPLFQALAEPAGLGAAAEPVGPGESADLGGVAEPVGLGAAAKPADQRGE